MAESSDRRFDPLLGVILACAAALRLSTWPKVFIDGRVYIDGVDGYYHLRRALLTLRGWPHVPQFDPWLNAPAGGRISWPPLFDWLLATLALPWRANPEAALERIGALLPPVLGVAQVAVMYFLLRALAGRRAALIAAAAAAVLPGAVRYALVGALDHDPFYELNVLLALLAVALFLRDQHRSSIALLTIALVMAFLGWAGSLVLAAILASVVTCVLIVSRREAARAAEVIAQAAAAASIVILPFVLTSVWTRQERATFEGLSLLHEAVLVAMALGCGALVLMAGERKRRHVLIVAAAAAASALLLPGAIGPLIAGVRYAAGEPAILGGVVETQPLLLLFGRFDPTAMLIRLTLIPVIALVVLPFWMLRGRRPIAAAVVLGWLAPAFALALLHSRFSYSAALASAAAAGLLIDGLAAAYERRRVIIAVVALALPTLLAYIPVSRWTEFNFYRRPNMRLDLEFDRISDRLRARPEGNAFAPWYVGHWILWSARKPVVQSPMLSVGQSQFAEASRFYFVRDPEEALRMLDKWDVRYVIVMADPENLEELGRVGGVDATGLYISDASGNRTLNTRVYVTTVAGRLSLLGPNGLPRFRQIDRTGAHVATPFGPVPFVRVYEIVR